MHQSQETTDPQGYLADMHIQLIKKDYFLDM